jgi:hypothetical protein
VEWIGVGALAAHLEVVVFSSAPVARTFLAVFLALGLEAFSDSLIGPVTQVSMGAVAGLGGGCA